MKDVLRRLFPFLAWFPMLPAGVRADVIAGLSVAMILVPQSMAYATLAGLPVVYGLYAAALPVVVGSLWGSSRFPHTGPVAMLSLLSAASLAPFAVAGTDYFIQLSIMLALMVGLMRLFLGLFRLGIIMNFVSHPVMVGFTNAADCTLMFSGLKKPVREAMERARLMDELGPENIFPNKVLALETLRGRDAPAASRVQPIPG